MIRRLASQSARFAALFAAALAVGCIDNPGVDPELTRSKGETTTLRATWRQGNLLNLKLQRDSGRVTLVATNTGLAAIDSATFLIRAMPGMYGGINSKYAHLRGLPDLNYYGKVAGLSPGQSSDLGEIGTLEDEGFDGRDVRAFLISLHQGGERKSSPFAGVYSGTHARFDSSGRASEGPVQGTISADGAFLLGLYSNSSDFPLGILDGSTREDGTFPDWFHLREGSSSGRTGGLRAESKGFRGSFVFDGRTDYYDSIQVRCEPFLPR